MDLLEPYNYIYPIGMRWQDLDMMGHVNSAVYVTYQEQARLKYFLDHIEQDWSKFGMVVANINIDYRQEIKYTHKPEIAIRCSRLGTKSLTFEYLMIERKQEDVTLFSTSSTVLVAINPKREDYGSIARLF